MFYYIVHTCAQVNSSIELKRIVHTKVPTEAAQAFEELAVAFEATTPDVDVRLTTGGSSTLRELCVSPAGGQSLRV